MPTPEARRHRHRIYLSVTVIVSALLVLGIGVQARLYQNEQADDKAALAAQAVVNRARLACLETWGKSMVDTVETRTGERAAIGTIDIEAAEAARDNALDDALLLLRADTDAPPPREEQVQAAARRYYQAVADLRKVRAETKQTRANNPYPELQC